MSELNKEQVKVYTYAAIAVMIVIIAAYAGKKILESINGIFDGLGLTDSRAAVNLKEEINKAKTSNKSAFSPLFYVTPPNGKNKDWNRYLKTDKAVNSFIVDLFGVQTTASRLFPHFKADDFGKAETAFSQLKYKTQVSQVAAAFAAKYKLDLLSFLSSLANDESEIQTLLNIIKRVNNLDSGFVRK